MIRIEHLPADVLDRSPIARDAASGRLAPALARVPRTIDELEPPSERLTGEQRAELARALETGLVGLEPPVAALDSARSLAHPRTCAVVTGQQPGFLCSPLLALYKAVHAIRLARALAQRWERAVVPIFWNHADDHDVAEVHHAWVLNAHLDLQKLGLAGLASGRQPVSRIVLDDERHRLGAIREALRQLVRDEPHGEEAIELFVPRHGEGFARAFTRALTALLGPHGLVVLEPDWIRPQLSRELARVVGADPAARLAEGAQRVRAAGYEVAIEPAEAALCFRVDERGRHALRAGGDGFRYTGEDGSRTATELAALIAQDPSAWSAGALLRPLVQDLALPVAAYVGGMAELAYHAELGPLREALDAPRTPFVPRLSCTLVDGGARFALARLETSVGEVLRARGTFAPPAARVDEPPVVARLRAVGEGVRRELDLLRPDFAELDPGLGVQLKRAGDQARDLLGGLADKALRVQQNRAGKGRRHERRVNNLLYPEQTPQERLLGPLQFVARHGTGWIEELLSEIDPLGREHVVVHLPDDARAENDA